MSHNPTPSPTSHPGAVVPLRINILLIVAFIEGGALMAVELADDKT